MTDPCRTMVKLEHLSDRDRKFRLVSVDRYRAIVANPHPMQQSGSYCGFARCQYRVIQPQPINCFAHPVSPSNTCICPWPNWAWSTAMRSFITRWEISIISLPCHPMFSNTYTKTGAPILAVTNDASNAMMDKAWLSTTTPHKQRPYCHTQRHDNTIIRSPNPPDKMRHQ